MPSGLTHYAEFLPSGGYQDVPPFLSALVKTLQLSEIYGKTYPWAITLGLQLGWITATIPDNQNYNILGMPSLPSSPPTPHNESGKWN